MFLDGAHRIGVRGEKLFLILDGVREPLGIAHQAERVLEVLSMFHQISMMQSYPQSWIRPVTGFFSGVM
jgi:hypothetical protein